MYLSIEGSTGYPTFIFRNDIVNLEDYNVVSWFNDEVVRKLGNGRNRVFGKF